MGCTGINEEWRGAYDHAALAVRAHCTYCTSTLYLLYLPILLVSDHMYDDLGWADPT
jgi:hypothetical protein